MVPSNTILPLEEDNLSKISWSQSAHYIVYSYVYTYVHVMHSYIANELIRRFPIHMSTCREIPYYTVASIRMYFVSIDQPCMHLSQFYCLHIVSMYICLTKVNWLFRLQFHSENLSNDGTVPGKLVPCIYSCLWITYLYIAISYSC